MAYLLLDRLQRFFGSGVDSRVNTCQIGAVNVRTHSKQTANLAVPVVSNASHALVLTAMGTAFESENKMKPMSNRPKTQAEQCLFEVLSKLGQGPGESGTINVDAVSALGQMEHQLDELTRQRDELIELSKAVLEAYDGCECLEGEKITKNHCPCCLLRAAIAAAERGNGI